MIRGEVGLDLGDGIALVVEIAESTIARDLGLKRLAYARAGITECWVVDGERSVVHVFAEPVGAIMRRSAPSASAGH